MPKYNSCSDLKYLEGISHTAFYYETCDTRVRNDH